MQRKIILDNTDEAFALMGVLNTYASLIDDAFCVDTTLSNDGLLIKGDDLSGEQAEVIWRILLDIYHKEGSISERQVKQLILAASEDREKTYNPSNGEVICVSAKGRPVRPKTRGQALYTEAMAKNELTFAIGPAGTGKTFLAVAMAVRAFRAHEVSRIILTRPAVEAGENLGFLPGDLQSKVDPYMRPLYDALYELLGADQFARSIEKGTIEISPLAYMRGRTLDDSYIILDEAQNTSPEQMKMFLTRIGFHSKVVVTGDITQIDLPRERRSGLIDMKRILHGVAGISFVELDKNDVVRNPLVQKIIAAYEKDEEKNKKGPHMQKWKKSNG